MVVIGISPGLANQMYEYAAAYALSRELGQELVLDISECMNAPWGYMLDFFSIPQTKKLLYFADDVEHIGHTDTDRIPQSLKGKVTIFTEESRMGTIRYDSIGNVCKDFTGDIYLCGYFFSRSKYYDKYWNEIKNSFVLDVKIREVECFCNLIKNKISIGIHIRRGDMLLADWAISMEDDYYRAAIEYCRKYLGECHFFIFSDDIEYAKKILGKDSSLWYIHFIGHHDADIAEFFCLSLCNHRILSNSSTFGRLADELNTNLDGKTFYQGEPSSNKSWLRHSVRKVCTGLSLYRNDKQTIWLDKSVIKKYNKRYRQDGKDNIANYNDRVSKVLREKVTEDNCEIVLNELAELSLNTHDLSLKVTDQLLYQKFCALVKAKKFHLALTVATPIYEAYADDMIYRDNLQKALSAIGAQKEANIEAKRCSNRKQFIIIPAGQTCISMRRYGLVEVGIILHHLGHRVTFIVDSNDKMEEFFIGKESLVNRRGIDLGCKAYHQKSVKSEGFDAFLNKFQEEELFILTRNSDFCGHKTQRKHLTYIFPDFMDQRDAESRVGQRMRREDVEYLYTNADVIMTQDADSIHNNQKYILWNDDDKSESYWVEERSWKFGDLDRFSARAICMADALHEYVCQK